MASVLRERAGWAFHVVSPDQDRHVGISTAYRDCLRDTLSAIRDMSAWLDAASWQPMHIEPSHHSVPSEAVKRCLSAHEAHQQLTARKGSQLIHRAHYRLAEATAQALSPFWAVYDYWSQCHGDSACDCEDCTELDAHWRDVEAHLNRHDDYVRRYSKRLTETSQLLTNLENLV